jgi:hypothetical protein
MFTDEFKKKIVGWLKKWSTKGLIVVGIFILIVVTINVISWTLNGPSVFTNDSTASTIIPGQGMGRGQGMGNSLPFQIGRQRLTMLMNQNGTEVVISNLQGNGKTYLVDVNLEYGVIILQEK